MIRGSDRIFFVPYVGIVVVRVIIVIENWPVDTSHTECLTGWNSGSGNIFVGMEEIMKGFRGPLTVKYWTNTAHGEHYNNSSGVKSLAVPIASSSPICKD